MASNFKARKNCEDLVRQEQSIQFALVRQDSQFKHEYWLRLTTSVDVVRLLLNQGLAFQGHNESKSSLNKGNFLEILSWYSERCDNIKDFAIIEELNGDYFALLVDESFDVSRKEQMNGFVMERLIDIIHVQDTCASSLKEAIVNLLAQHSLSLSYVRGQCYDGASNMQASFKRMDEYRESQKKRVQEALDMGELETGRGLHQEFGLTRACDTRWGSHYKSFSNFILMFDSIVDVLNDIIVDSHCPDESAKKKEQDIVNAMLLVQVAKKRLQKLREEEWGSLINKLSYRFDEVTTDLLHGIACLNPIDSFSSFDLRKIMRMAKHYPDEFDEFSMGVLENQLASYIIDVRDLDERFSNLKGLCDLSKRLVQTKKHSNYPLVFLLVKLALLLLVATASVERTFSAMKFIKNDLRSRISESYFSGCLVPYVEKDVFNRISNDVITKTFQGMKHRRVQL
ncbi:uncharacterized protein LOC129894953 [Solanum dulcamara]|uniref:uncharacterized protein LOC129894953 n=1 Tax=Solanum dulcamara TaxID=45834 RepID=UPI00248516FC|nr:uncharacterized protein LOC129894953 [Solanum dulcamara]